MLDAAVVDPEGVPEGLVGLFVVCATSKASTSRIFSCCWQSCDTKKEQ